MKILKQHKIFSYLLLIGYVSLVYLSSTHFHSRVIVAKSLLNQAISSANELLLISDSSENCEICHLNYASEYNFSSIGLDVYYSKENNCLILPENKYYNDFTSIPSQRGPPSYIF